MSNQPEFKNADYQNAIYYAEYNILLNKIYRNKVSYEDIKQFVNTDSKIDYPELIYHLSWFGYILLKLRNNNFENIYEKSFNLIMTYIQKKIDDKNLEEDKKKFYNLRFLEESCYDLKVLNAMLNNCEYKAELANELIICFIKSFNTIISSDTQKNTPEYVHDVIKTLLKEGARTEDLLFLIVSLEYPYNETILNTVLASPDCHLDQISDQASYTILQNTISHYASTACLPTSNIINNLLNKGLYAK